MWRAISIAGFRGIVARTYRQQTVDDLALWSSVPVINALSDMWHPCQALADMQTIREHFGETRGLKLAFVGDGNNVAASLLVNATRLGMKFSHRDADGLRAAPGRGRSGSGKISKSAMTRPTRFVTRRSIYTDVWTSMGEEHEAAARRAAFAGYQVNDALFAHAAPEAIFMHCLPAHRGEEVTDSVIESSRSVVFDEAENRLHAQKALLLMLLGRDSRTAMKLWGGRFETGPSEVFERFSNSLHFDRRLLAADVRGSQAFARSLTRAGVLTDAECATLCSAFDAIRAAEGDRLRFLRRR